MRPEVSGQDGLSCPQSQTFYGQLGKDYLTWMVSMSSFFSMFYDLLLSIFLLIGLHILPLCILPSSDQQICSNEKRNLIKFDKEKDNVWGEKPTSMFLLQSIKEYTSNSYLQQRRRSFPDNSLNTIKDPFVLVC